MLFKLYKHPVFLGQLLSLCITLCNLSTGALVDYYKLKIPYLQTGLNYILLFIIYGFWLTHEKGIEHVLSLLKTHYKIFFILSLLDFEANFFIVTGFSYTSYLSAMLINASSTPAVALLSYFFLNVRYKINHIFALMIALVGLFLIIINDATNEKGNDKLLGDFYCVIGALLYASSNTLEEKLIRGLEAREVLMMLGLFGSIINPIQGFFLSGFNMDLAIEFGAVGLILLFTFSLFILYSLAPVLMSISGATFYNLSLLTADFYGLILGILFLPIKINWIFPFAFSLIIMGCVIFNWIPVENISDDQELEYLVERNDIP